ncbi:helix-turn-helix domain-containing protein [Oscillibacter sp. CU971]|uniref:helix-turn-helix domain-containing protein n=1 Tax=Oscillibacter sp. CU971 TaxID=2780102 RepID=UPI001FAEF02E|nr:helix-turn-helix transcriptional regulator [Oscillibacter sp. CU971]
MMDQEYWKIIANRILSLRAKRGFSTYKLESMSGVDASTIESIEKGQSKNPTIQTLHKIAIAFNMTIAEFLDFSELNEFSFDDTSKDEDD